MAFPKPFYRWRPHPWHGLEIGPNAPQLVHAYIEITPFDTVKYEIDKETGYLAVDRPQRTSSLPPTLYGLVPRTYCGERTAQLMEGAMVGDCDPLDICVVSERPISRAEVILKARVVGGLPMLDGGEADDKIIAVLDKDPLYEGVNDISELPVAFVERLHHYFMTYKLVPGEEDHEITINGSYGREHAEKVIRAAADDYEHEFGG